MVNPNKTYNLPCKLDTFFDDAGGNLLVRETIKLGKRQFQMNGYLIEVEDPWIEVLERDVYEHEEECDCGCKNSK